LANDEVDEAVAKVDRDRATVRHHRARPAQDRLLAAGPLVQGFPLLISVPGKAGQVLSFKTVQTYSNGKVVRWIEGPDGEQPAPTVNVTAAGGFIQEQAGDAGPPAPGSSPAGAEGQTQAKPAVIQRTVTKSAGASKDLGIAALVVAILALIAGLAALATRHRANPSAA
jgi:hypothetical protein